MRLRSGPATVALLLSVVGVAACTSSTPNVSAPVLLQKAKEKADHSSSVHFVLTSSNVALSGTNIVGGEGDLARPSSLRGSFNVAIAGLTAPVKVVSVGNVFEAELPLSNRYEKTDPANFGLTNPAELLDPDKGLTHLLAIAQDPQSGGQERLGGQVVDKVTFTVPGEDIPVLPDANPSKPVQLTVAIDPKTFELRSVTLVGPLTSATSDSTFVVTLTNYNEHIDITLPPTA